MPEASKDVNFNYRERIRDKYQHIVDTFNKPEYRSREEPVIIMICAKVGIPRDALLHMDLYEMALDEIMGEKLEIPISGFIDPFGKYTPGEILAAKLVQTMKDYEAGTIELQPYWYRNGAPCWKDFAHRDIKEGRRREKPLDVRL